MKVVIDTNILIGSTEDEFSHSKQIIDKVIAGELEAYASHQTRRENQLLLKRMVPNPGQKAFLEDYFAQVQEVRPKRRVTIVKEDPEDNKFIETALEAKASYIITSDAHLLDLEEFEGIRVLSPEDFLYAYKEKQGGKSEFQDMMKDIMGI